MSKKRLHSGVIIKKREGENDLDTEIDTSLTHNEDKCYNRCGSQPPTGPSMFFTCWYSHPCVISHIE